MTAHRPGGAVRAVLLPDRTVPAGGTYRWGASGGTIVDVLTTGGVQVPGPGSPRGVPW